MINSNLDFYLEPFNHNSAYWPSKSSKVNDVYVV